MTDKAILHGVDSTGVIRPVNVFSDGSLLISLPPISTDPVNNRVGINNPAPGYTLDISGTMLTSSQAGIGYGSSSLSVWDTLLLGERPVLDGVASLRLSPINTTGRGFKIDVTDPGTTSYYLSIFDQVVGTIRLTIDSSGDIYSEKGTWTPTWTGLTVTGTPIYTGTYRTVGSLLFWSVTINPNGGTTASAGGNGTYINNLPFSPSQSGTGIWTNIANGGSGGTCSVWGNHTNIYVPAWAASDGWWLGNGLVEL